MADGIFETSSDCAEYRSSLHFQLMLRRLAKVILLSLMLVLPAQGTAAALAQILCGTDNHEAVQTRSEAQVDHPTPHQQPVKGGASGQDDSVSFCWHHLTAGAPLGLLEAVAHLPVYHPSLPPFSLLFIPEQPQRPPRV